MKYLAALAIIAVGGCQNASQDKILEKMDKMVAAQQETNKLLKSGAGAARGGQQGQRPPQRRRGPQPGTRYAINVDGMPFEGNANAPVVIVKAQEYACPACYHAQTFTKQVLKEFGNDVKLVTKDFVVHPTRAWDQAFTACAANQQGKFKEMKEAIWEKGFKARKFDRAHYEGLAKEMGLNMAKFKKDYDGICNKLTRESHAEMQGVGVAGTPTFFVNGKVLERRSVDEVKKLVAEELKAYKASGAKSGSEFYAKHVIAKGTKPAKAPLPTIPKPPAAK